MTIVLVSPRKMFPLSRRGRMPQRAGKQDID
jgi:hypothetical protein